jgi:probable selenium-dependent hydroxylase accessory protein YqeC
MHLAQALSLAKKMTLCCVGGGGKTSLIFALARELSALGQAVLVTTTTAIFHPDHGNTPHSISYDRLVIGNIQQGCPGLSKAGEIVVAAQTHDPKTHKLKGYAPEILASILENHSFDTILIEADGSRHLPVKAPADHEPVIPDFTDMVIGCIGLDCLGKPMDEKTVHRPEIFSAIVNLKPGEPVLSDHLVLLAAAPHGLFKNTSEKMRKIVFLNKADTREQVQTGRILADRILRECAGVDNCLVGSLLNTKNPVQYGFTMDKRL